MALITEDDLEQQCLEWFQELGYTHVFAPQLDSDGTSCLLRRRGNLSLDWQYKENVRARLQTMIKALLKRYKYPPDMDARLLFLSLEVPGVQTCLLGPRPDAVPLFPRLLEGPLTQGLAIGTNPHGHLFALPSWREAHPPFKARTCESERGISAIQQHTARTPLISGKQIWTIHPAKLQLPQGKWDFGGLRRTSEKRRGCPSR